MTKDAAKANDPALYSPLKVSPEHLRGWWLRHTESVPPKQFVSSRWLILPKVRWLSAAWYPNEHSGMLFDDLGVSKYCTQHFGENSSALLLAEMQPGSNGWFEVSRGFVVSPGWPMLE